jgi:hypothetical protein
VTVIDSDREAHRRRKVRELERRVDFLENYRARLERMLGVAVRIIVAGKPTTEAAMLAVLEDFDRALCDERERFEAWQEKWDLSELLGGPS